MIGFKSFRLGEITKLISSGATPFGGSKTYLDKGPIIFLRSQNVRMGFLDLSAVAYISEQADQAISRTRVEYGDVLLNITGASIGRVAPFQLRNSKANVNQHVCVIRPIKEQLSSDYLAQYIATPQFQAKIEQMQSGGTRQALTFSKIADFDIPLPSLPEQKRIAAILDKADAIRRKRQQAIKLADDFLRAIFLDMFGDPVTNPKGWESVRLIEICAKITDGEHINPTFVENGFPIIMANNVRAEGVVFEGVKYVSKEDFEKFTKKCKPEKNDILVVSRGATIGRCTTIDTDRAFCLMGSTILLKVNHDRVTSSFLNYLLQHPAYQVKLYKTSSASAQQAIYLSHIKELPLALPPYRIQQNFSALVFETKKVVNRYLQSLAHGDHLFNCLTQRAFRGEL